MYIYATVCLIMIFYSGCTSSGGIKLRKYDIDCESCKVKMKYDVTREAKELKIKGLQQ